MKFEFEFVLLHMPMSLLITQHLGGSVIACTGNIASQHSGCV